MKERVNSFVSLEESIWLITHVSPGKYPLLETIGMHIKPDIWFSGHMDRSLTPMPLLQAIKAGHS